MTAFTVGWFCRSWGVRSLAGGIGHNVGRHEPVRCPIGACAKTNRVPLGGGARLVFRAGADGRFGVCTLCTLWASDWAVLGSDWAGLRRFSGVPRVCRGGSPVRVPPRARIIPRQRDFCFNVWTLFVGWSL